MVDVEKTLAGLKCCADLQRMMINRNCEICPYNDNKAEGTCNSMYPLLSDAVAMIEEQARRWRELRACITEMSTNGGTGSQQDVCRYLAHLMDVIEGVEK